MVYHVFVHCSMLWSYIVNGVTCICTLPHVIVLYSEWCNMYLCIVVYRGCVSGERGGGEVWGYWRQAHRKAFKREQVNLRFVRDAHANNNQLFCFKGFPRICPMVWVGIILICLEGGGVCVCKP